MKNHSFDTGRFLRLLTGVLVLVLYYIFTRLTGFGIPCMFHLFTGLSCPGCGISRLLISLVSGDLKAAFRYNAAVFCLLPVFFVLILYWSAGYLFHLKAGTRGRRAEKLLYLSLAVILILWGIVRNIIGM